jgi:hypothetical protein
MVITVDTNISYALTGKKSKLSKLLKKNKNTGS